MAKNGIMAERRTVRRALAFGQGAGSALAPKTEDYHSIGRGGAPIFAQF
jgi:hypothetical protein